MNNANVFNLPRHKFRFLVKQVVRLYDEGRSEDIISNILMCPLETVCQILDIVDALREDDPTFAK